MCYIHDTLQFLGVEINSKRNECITSPGKEEQNYFTMSRNSKREISFTCLKSSLFHSHCSVSGTSLVLSSSKTTNSRTCNYKKIRFNDSFDRGRKKRTAIVGGGSTTNQRETLDKFTTPKNSINRCFFGRLGVYCQGQKTGWIWTSQKKNDHINVLELRAVKYAILTFCRLHLKTQSIHIQMESIVALSYLEKMGGTRNKSVTVLSKEICDYLLVKEIKINAEYLPRLLNVEADTQPRTARDAREWKLNLGIFQKICKYRGTPDVYLFAS